MDYKHKYLKYKAKYLEAKAELEGGYKNIEKVLEKHKSNILVLEHSIKGRIN
jgi:hypothetical protein